MNNYFYSKINLSGLQSDTDFLLPDAGQTLLACSLSLSLSA